MVDMLVKLYELPPVPAIQQWEHTVIHIRRARPDEKHKIGAWVEQNVKQGWGDAAATACETRPPTCWIAVEAVPLGREPEHGYDMPSERLVGFACYDVNMRGILGPLGVREDYRHRGIGAALTVRALQDMSDQGYAYAVIQWAGDPDWYTRITGAAVIPDSEPGSTKIRLVTK